MIKISYLLFRFIPLFCIMVTRGDFMKVLSNLPTPVLAGVVREKSVKSAIAEIKNCMYDGAGMIDLHISCLERVDTNQLREIINSSKLPVLALNYDKTYDWQDAGFSEEERVESFLCAVDAGAAGIDMQGYSCERRHRMSLYFGNE